jgi:hypothetical protein
LDGPEIESRWEVRFSEPVQTGPGAHPVSRTMGNGSYREVKPPTPIYSRGREKSRIVSALPPQAFIACCRVKNTEDKN